MCHYFSNPLRLDFYNVSSDKMMKVLKEAHLDTKEINFILKMELIVPAIERGGEGSNLHVLENFVEKTKKFMSANRIYLRTSVKRMFKKFFEVIKKKAGAEGKSIVFGDAFDYHTFKDTLLVELKFKEFLIKATPRTFEDLVEVLTRIKVRRLCNLYLVLALFPTMIKRLTDYYVIELERITESNKKKVGDRLVSMIVLVCEYFQFLKNKGKQAEIITFRLLEMLLSGITKNKELFKELILRSFEYLETLPLHTTIQLTYGCNLFGDRIGTLAYRDGGGTP